MFCRDSPSTVSLAGAQYRQRNRSPVRAFLIERAELKAVRAGWLLLRRLRRNCPTISWVISNDRAMEGIVLTLRSGSIVVMMIIR